MRILQYQGTPDRGVWHPMSETEIKDWRKQAREKVAAGGRVVPGRGGVIRGRGGSLEWSTAHTDQAVFTEAEGNAATVDPPPREKGRLEAREAVEAVMKSYLDWAKEDPDAFLARVRQLQAAGEMTHLSAEEAATQLYEMAERIARDDVERAFQRRPDYRKYAAGIT